MTKTTGLGDRLYIGGVDVSGDIGAISEIGGGPAVVDVTNSTQNAASRLATAVSGQLTFDTWHDVAIAHPVLAPLPVTDVVTTYINQNAPSLPSAGLVARQVDYPPKRGPDGSMAFTVQCLSDGSGIEWGKSYCGGVSRSDSGPTAGASVDDGTSTALGLSAYLHVFSITGTSVIVVFQHSNDDGVTDPYTDLPGGIFAIVSAAPFAQRITTTGTQLVKRWIRIRTVGTFSAVNFFAMMMRSPTAILAGLDVTVDVQIFTSSGTYTKPPGVTAVLVAMLGGGGGGGRGGANNTVALSCGAGGAGGSYSHSVLPASSINSTEGVIVGAGGPGGTTASGATAGTTGGSSSFGSPNRYVFANGGGGGTGSSISPSTGGIAALSEQDSDAGANGVVGGAGVSPASGLLQRKYSAGSGASAGGMDLTPTAYVGGIGQGCFQTSTLGGTSGPLGGAGGDGGVAPVNSVLPGAGGGGGGSSRTTNGGNGGAGGRYGGGGGGGGGCPVGFTRGDGGPGASGIVVIVSW